MSELFDYYVEEGYTTPESADPPNTADYFIRALDACYAVDDYFADNYTVCIRDAISDTTSSVTVTAHPDTDVFGTGSVNLTVNSSITAGKITGGVATLREAGDDKTWAEMRTWLYPAQESWGQRVRVSAIKQVAGVATLDTNLTVSTTGNTFSRSSTVNITNAGTIVISANATVRPGADLTITSSVSAAGASGLFGTATLPSNTTVSAAGTYQISVDPPDLSAATTVSARGSNTLVGSTSTTLSSSVSAEFGRIRPGSSTHSASSSVSSSAETRSTGSATLNTIAQSTQQATNTIRGTQTALAELDISINGGKLIGLSETLPIIITVDAQGKIVTIDPYRRIRVVPESRTREIDQETRITHAYAENRVNTAQGERRLIQVLPESRRVIIKRGTLVVESLSPYRQERV